MSSTSTTTAPATGAPAGGVNMFVGLVPWVLFSVIAHHGALKIASVVALVAAVAITAWSASKGERPKVLELGGIAAFAGFVVVAFAVDASTGDMIARYARGIAAATLALIAFGSLLFTPFTEQYARAAVPEKFWSSPRFHETNRKLTAMWGAIFLAMVPLHVLAGAIDRPITNIALNWAAPLAMVMWGLKRSTTTGGVDDAMSTTTA
ncbi:MAG: hypothetical protein ACRDL5_17695 [Solirubrobacteraceae bacterium]